MSRFGAADCGEISHELHLRVNLMTRAIVPMFYSQFVELNPL